jgi:integral membrane sensor domain MASE1
MQQETSAQEEIQGRLISKGFTKHPVQTSRTAAYLTKLVLVLVAYFVVGVVGLAVPFTNGNVSPVWPASVIALGAILLVGYRIWPAIALGAFLVNLLTPIPPVAALGIAVGNTIGPLIGAWLMGRFTSLIAFFSNAPSRASTLRSSSVYMTTQLVACVIFA